MTPERAELIKRLNELFRLARIDAWTQTDAALEKLRDKLYWVLYVQERRLRQEKNNGQWEGSFEIAATREGIKSAQQGLCSTLSAIQHGTKTPQLPLAKQRLLIFMDKTGFFARHETTDFPTMTNTVLAYLLERSGVKRSDFLTCSNAKCSNVFVPLRKPQNNTPHYCSSQCGNMIAAREYRKRNGQGLKGREKERSHRRYVEKVRSKPNMRNAKVARRPRKPR